MHGGQAGQDNGIHCRVSDRNDTVYINQLLWIKSKLVEEERYEEADKIDKLIKQELDNLNNRKHEFK